MVAWGHCRQITYQFLLVVGAFDGVTRGGRTFVKRGEACSNPWGARSASLQWGSEGTAPSVGQRQSPWSGVRGGGGQSTWSWKRFSPCRPKRGVKYAPFLFANCSLKVCLKWKVLLVVITIKLQFCWQWAAIGRLSPIHIFQSFEMVYWVIHTRVFEIVGAR